MNDNGAALKYVRQSIERIQRKRTDATVISAITVEGERDQYVMSKELQ